MSRPIGPPCWGFAIRAATAPQAAGLGWPRDATLWRKRTTAPIGKPIIRWQRRPQLGYEILPNKYFYRYQPPPPATDLLKEFWRLEKEAEKMLERLATT